MPATTEELLEVVFTVRSMLRLYNDEQLPLAVIQLQSEQSQS
jgi:hypothetical protein